MTLAVGSTVVFRDVRDGIVFWAWPGRVIGDDRGTLVAQRPGAVGRVPSGYPADRGRVFELLRSRQPPEIVELTWTRTITLSVHRDGAWWQPRLFWDAESGAFLGYYVDFVEPLGRHGVFIDFVDLALDVVVEPDGAWRWKDVDEFKAFTDAGIIGPDAAARVEAAKPEVISAIETRAFPFDGSLADWRWPADMPAGVLPTDWARIVHDASDR